MRACVVIAEDNIRRAVSIAEKFTMAEIRLDLCQFKTSHLNEIFALSIDTIATYRERDEMNASAEKMDQLKKAISAGAKYIDVELSLNAAQSQDLISYAKAYGAKVIVSHHDFDKTPSLDVLRQIIQQSREIGADIVKIATKVNFRDDCIHLMSLYHGEENLIAFGMGEDAKFTRITSMFLGAPFGYVHYLSSSKTAKGQLSYKEFDTIMSNLY